MLQPPLAFVARLALWTAVALSTTTRPASANERGGGAVSSPPPYRFDARRGWHFYEPMEIEGEDTTAAIETPSPPAVTTAPKRPPELVQFERLQQTLEQYRNVAIMRPTEANVRRYMTLEAKVVARASYFADVAQRVAWTTPELDPSLQGRPLNAKALEVFERQQLSQRSRSIGTLGQDHVLFFFFRGDCPYCHAFAPTLAAFERRHGIEVVAVSMDGGSMPGFPDARADNGIARSLQVSRVPALFLAQPFTGQITPIGFGVLSEAELLERIATLSAPVPESVLPNRGPYVAHD